MVAKSPYSALLNEACVSYGFCGCVKDGEPLHVDDFIPERGQVSADQFVDWLFLADNLDPAVNDGRTRRMKAGLRDAFVEHMGGEVVDAGRLRWS